MLDIWKQITELSFRGFGKKKRKMPKMPGNWDIWSDESKTKWMEQQKEKLDRSEKWDMNFIANETRVVDELCRQIVYLIDKANTMNPQYLCECDRQRLLQDEAIGLCSNLSRELNHIADTLPSNKNFLAIQDENIDKEITLLRGWRKSCNAHRATIIAKEIERRKTIAEKIGFISGKEEIGELLKKQKM